VVVNNNYKGYHNNKITTWIVQLMRKMMERMMACLTLMAQHMATLEACLTQIDDGSLDLDGTGKGIKLHSSLDLDGKADGTADGLLDFNGTADGNDCLRIYQKYKNKQMGFFGLIPHGKV
jgi:hypothetical protein